MKEALRLLDMLAHWPTGSPASPAWLRQATAARDAIEQVGTALVALDDDASSFVRAVGEALLARPRTENTGGGAAWQRYMVMCSRPAKAQALQHVLAWGPTVPGELATFAAATTAFGAPWARQRCNYGPGGLREAPRAGLGPGAGYSHSQPHASGRFGLS